MKKKSSFKDRLGTETRVINREAFIFGSTNMQVGQTIHVPCTPWRIEFR